MLRLIASLTVGILANATGLIVAAVSLENFSLNAMSFIIATLIFSAVVIVLGPLVTKIALTKAPYLMGGIALVTTLISLIITNVMSNGISIQGLGTWIAATVIIWVFSIIGNLFLPLLIFKKTLASRRD